MHWAEIVAWLAGIRQALGFIRDVLGAKKDFETTKGATAVFDVGKRLLRIPAPDIDDETAAKDAAAVDELSIKRARAAADLIRSYSLFGALEYMRWATQAALIIYTINRTVDRFTRAFKPRRRE